MLFCFSFRVSHNHLDCSNCSGHYRGLLRICDNIRWWNKTRDYQPGGVASQANTHMHPRTIHSHAHRALTSHSIQTTMLLLPPCKAGAFVHRNVFLLPFPNCCKFLVVCSTLSSDVVFFSGPKLSYPMENSLSVFLCIPLLSTCVPLLHSPPLSFRSWRLKNWLPEVNFNTKFHNCEI